MRRKMVFTVAVGFLFVFPVLLSAQTAAEVETILKVPAITCDQAARFVLLSTEAPDSTTDGSGTAFKQAMANGWFSKKAAPKDNITLGELSFLLMKAFNLEGGVMYRLLPGPRYAYRAMVSQSYIQGAADPALKVSGERFLQILGKVLNATGG